MDKYELVMKFKEEIYDRMRIVDKNDGYDWWSLTYGWLMGKGLKPQRAASIATEIRYDYTNCWYAESHCIVCSKKFTSKPVLIHGVVHSHKKCENEARIRVKEAMRENKKREKERKGE